MDSRKARLRDLAASGLPVWCRGPSPLTLKRLGLSGAFCVPVSCGGVALNPGDAVLADESGIVVLRPDSLDDVLEEALWRQKREPALMARLCTGERLHDILGAGAQVEAAIVRV